MPKPRVQLGIWPSIGVTLWAPNASRAQLLQMLVRASFPHAPCPVRRALCDRWAWMSGRGVPPPVAVLRTDRDALQGLEGSNLRINPRTSAGATRAAVGRPSLPDRHA